MADMRAKIADAQVQNPDGKVTVNLAIPVAYVGDRCVWPEWRVKHRQANRSYLDTTSGKSIFEKAKISDFRNVSSSEPEMVDIDDYMGHKFSGAFFLWKSNESAKSIIEKMVTDEAWSFPVDKKRDDVIYAAVRVKRNEIEFECNGGHEKGAEFKLLHLMEK